MENRSKQNTYQSGFQMTFGKNLTRQQYVQICEKLSGVFNDFYGASEFRFEPEPITEGGLQMTAFPNKSTQMFKTMRHRHAAKKWPWINKTVLEDWKHDNTVLFEKGEKIETFLKALQNAPAWTRQELELMAECFKDFGIVCKKMPKLSE